MGDLTELETPFLGLDDLYDQLLSARAYPDRLKIIRKRLKINDVFEAKPCANAKQILTDIICLYPFSVTDDWIPDTNFIERFWKGEFEFKDGNIIGGPHENTEGHQEEEIPEIIKSFTENLEVDAVRARIIDHVRNDWVYEKDVPEFIIKTRFWPLIDCYKELSEIYGENPCDVFADFFGKFFYGKKVETVSAGSVVPEGSQKE